MTHKQLLDRARELLGLGPDDHLEEGEALDLPTGSVGHGLTAAPARGLAKDRLDAILAGGYLPEVSLEPKRGLGRLAWAGGLAWLSSPGALVPLEGATTKHADMLVADPGTAPVFLLAPEASPPSMLILAGEQARLVPVSVETESRAAALRSWSPPRPATVPAPDLGSLLGDKSCPKWLTAEASRLAEAPAPLDRLAAAGLLLRLWTPPSTSDATALLQELLAGSRPTVGRAVRDWAQSLSPDALDAAERALLREADDLLDALDALHDAVAADDSACAEAIETSTVVRRDDLESAQAVLECASRGRLSREGLDAVDRKARFALTTLSLVAVSLDRDRLRAVAACEPNAWWGALLSDG